MTDRDLVLAIVAEMNGKEWSADTLDNIAALLAGAGHRLRDVEEAGEAVEWSGMSAATRHMHVLDGAGDPYVVESIKLASGVVLRAKSGPGFEVLTHNAAEISVQNEAGFYGPFALRADQLVSLSVLPL